MIETMGTRKDAYAWIRKNTALDCDTMLFDFEQLEVALKRGWLGEMPDNKGYYNPVYENDWGEYKVTSVYRVEGSVIRKNLLIYPYRFKAELVKPSKLFYELEDAVKKDLLHVDCAITAYPEYDVINSYCGGMAV